MTSRQNGASDAKNSALNAAQSAQRREDIRLTKMMLTIFLCFLVCFLPLMLVNVADDDVQFPFLHIVASVLAWASAVVNPFIYAFKNRQYQQAFIKVIIFSNSSKYFLKRKDTMVIFKGSSTDFVLSRAQHQRPAPRSQYKQRVSHFGLQNLFDRYATF